MPEPVKYTVALLMSGGLDSFIAWKYAEHLGLNTIPLWVNLGQPYAAKEKKAVKRLNVPVRIIEAQVLQEYWGNMPTVDDQIIPGRNGLLAHIGAMFADEVWIVALDGEMHPFMVDKNQAFFESASKYMTQIFGTPKLIRTPFPDKTKADIVKWALEHGVTPETMRRSVTCYDAKLHACGECSTCLKRWIAMSLNGVEEQYTVEPWKTGAAKMYFEKIRQAHEAKDFEHYSEKRCQETMAAVGKVLA